MTKAVISVAALALWAAPADDQTPIRIGVPTGLGGASSAVAPSVIQASQLAVDEIADALHRRRPAA